MKEHGMGWPRMAQLTAVALASTLVWTPGAWADSFECLIAPAQVVEIRSSVEGLINKIYVQRGDAVKQGETLVQLDASAERSTMEAAKYRAQMGGRITTARNRLAFASKKFERLDGLSKKQYVAAQVRDEAETEKRLAESELQDAVESQELAKREYKHAVDIVNLRTLHSPFNGVVVDRSSNPGDLAQAGNGKKPILTLAKIDPLKVEVILPLDMYGQVKLGMTGLVTPEKLGGAYPASVRVVDKVVDAASGTFGVRLEMSNDKQAIPGGIRCQIDFSALKPSAMPTERNGVGPVSFQKGRSK